MKKERSLSIFALISFTVGKPNVTLVSYSSNKNSLKGNET